MSDADRLNASIEELERERARTIELTKRYRDLIAVLAHDIKGPLTSIIGFAELLEEGFVEGDAAVDAARTIRHNGERLGTLASDILALSRVEPGELDLADERVDLTEIVKHVVEGYGKERAVAFSTEISSAYVRGDADRLRQALEIVVGNALKYSPEGEAVDVIVSSDGPSFRVRVEDRGMGIPPEDFPRIFSRFSRASNARRAKIAGTGIGLFIAKTIVERHEGSISAQSIHDEGSVFTITLPNPDAVVWPPRRVMVASSDRDLRQFLAHELRARKYRVREAATLEDVAKLDDVRPGDVILADSGVATPDQLRAAVGPVPVRVVVMGEDAFSGWDATLPKPFLVRELLAALAPDG
ncbi:MAG: ATP-binding protein [Candidatus Baltobacteraceae bacterium]